MFYNPTPKTSSSKANVVPISKLVVFNSSIFYNAYRKCCLHGVKLSDFNQLFTVVRFDLS